MSTDAKALRGVYTPNDVATYTMEIVDKRHAEQGLALRTSIGRLDYAMRPVLPGEMVFVTAFTGNGKTAFMQYWARQVVRQLQERATMDEIVVYITWETLVEELGLYDLCGVTGIDAGSAWYGDVTQEEVTQLRVAAMKRAAMPLWIVGDSLKRRRTGSLTMEDVSESLRVVEQEHGLKPAIIFVDYIQIVPPLNQRDDMRVQVLKNVDLIRQLARDCGAPIIAGCQAGRQVLARDFKLPEVGDGQETSRIEQNADKVLALWYPCNSEPIGSHVEEVSAIVDERLMIMGIRKQRHAPSGQIFALDFDAPRNTFASWDSGVVLE